MSASQSELADMEEDMDTKAFDDAEAVSSSGSGSPALDDEGSCVEGATPAASVLSDGGTTQQTQQQQQHVEQGQEQQAEAAPQPQAQPAAAKVETNEVETNDEVRIVHAQSPSQPHLP